MKKFLLVQLISCLFWFQFAFARQQNMIPVFMPKAGPVGSIVTISSVGNATQYTVFFGIVKAEILSSSVGTLNVRVPRGATNSPITVVLHTANGVGSVMTAQAFMVTFPNVGELSLTHHSSLTSAGVSKTAIADIDNDGKPDIIALNPDNNQFSIFRNTSTYDGTGFSFAAASIFNTGASPQSVAVGDLNMDGKFDLVLANSADNTIYVFINQSTSGNLSFAVPLIVVAGSPTSVAIGELNKDYRPDIVATNSSGNKISILHNASTLGSGFSLSTRADFATGSNPVSVALGNMDLAHGVLHITTANRGDNSLSAFQIESFGNYIISKVIATGTEPSYITHADIDADGLSEMMVVNSGSSSVSIYRNKRGGSSSGVSFEDKIDFPFTSGLSSAAVSDLDGDGKNDIIGIGAGVLSFLRSTTSLANIGFAPKVDFNAQNNPVAIAVADLNGDSRPDILLADPLANSIQILENKLIVPVVSPPLISSIAPLKAPVGTEIVISGSGFDAIPENNLVAFGSIKATVLSSGANTVRVRVPSGIVSSKIRITNLQNSLSTSSIETFQVTFDTLSSLSFGNAQNWPAENIPYKLGSADFDGDGLIDIATFLGNSMIPAIFHNKSSNGKSKFQKTVINGAFEYLSGVAAEDLNGDGKPDLIFSSSRQYVYIFENTSSSGSISFGLPKKYVTGTLGQMGNGILARDIDHDGRPDIIISGRLETGNTQVLTFLLNRSQTTLDFSRSLSFPFFEGAGSVYELAAGDLNADGKTDLVLTSPIRDSIYIYRNDSEKGNLAFNISGIKTAAFPSGIIMEDIDADGKLDINVINKSQGLSSYRNISTGGNINFGPAYLTGIGKHSLSIKSSDINGDGKPDFVIANYGDSTITVLKNYSSPANFNYTSETISSGVAAYDLALEDINLDGKPEIVFSNLSANAISVLQNETLSALNLKQLTVNTGTIFPEFSPPVKEYEIKVAPETSSVNFNAEAALISATLNLNAALLGTGTGSKSVSISSDTTLVELTVTHSSKTNTYNFKILRVLVPIIESFIPLQGPPGTIVEIKGRNFDNPLSLKIGAKEAVIVSASSSAIKAMLMQGSVTGEVKFSSNNGTSSSLPNQFTVTGTGIPSTLIGAKLYDEQAMSMGASSALSSDGTTMVAGTSSSSGGFWIYARSQNTDAWVKKGSKRKGSGGSGDNSEGISIAISANGNTIATGAPGDNNGFGAVWIYERSGDDWIQQGLKLTATFGSGLMHFGSSVSLSSDGNTLLIGAEKHSLGDGWIWVFTRNAGVWTEQQSFTGLDQTRPASKGSNVKLSADGNRALFTGHTNNVNNGMVWLFSRSNGFWKHEAKFSSGEAGAMNFGSSIDLSADGRTAIIGSAAYQSTGASWIYTEAGGVWTKQAKLIGTGATGNARQGESVAISADGNIAFVGGSADDSNKGAFWIFKRTGSAWQQIGIKGKINGTSGNSKLGSSIDISSDGLFAVLGTPADEEAKGGVWVHKYIPSTATLSSLSLITGTLDPVFSADITSYSSNVAKEVDSVKVIPGLKDMISTVRVNGILVLNGSASPIIPLLAGENVISVQVSAQDTSIKKTYSIRVNRTAPSTIATLASLSLSTGVLDPVFSSDKTSYNVNVAKEISSVKVIPGLTDTLATVKLNGITVSKGSSSSDIPLLTGTNLLSVQVIAQDTSVKKTYTINIVRAAPSAIATLASLSLSTGVLDPVFSSDKTSYSVNVAKEISSVKVIPGLTDTLATVKLNGISVSKGSSSTDISLITGLNVLSVQVIAQDTSIKKTYAINIVRAAPSTIATLSSLTLNPGVLGPVFSADITTYNVSVRKGIGSVRVIPVLTDTLATVRVNGTILLKGSTSSEIPLLTGENVISVLVTAQDTSIKKAYTIKVVREAPSSVATLSSITLSSGILSPIFAAETGNYFVELSNTATAIRLSAGITDTSSRLTLNGLSLASGVVSNDLNLVTGSNLMTFVITAENGTTKKTYTVNVVRAAANQTYPDSKGTVTVSSTTPQVMVVNSSIPITVSVPDGVGNASINYSSLISSGTGVLPQTTLNSTVAQLTIPQGTTVTSSSLTWNGVLNVPQPTNYELPNNPGEITTYGLGIEVGSPDVALLFNKAVRLVLPGQAGKRAGFVRLGIFTEISKIGTTDSQSEGDALSAGGAYKIDVGLDLVIWTKGFSKFITFTRSIDPDVASVALDMASITDSVIKGNNIDLGNVITSLTNPLPVKGSNGSQIIWSSGNPLVLSSDGKTVVRPASGITTVTLTANFKKGNIINSKTFTIKILAISPPQISSFAPEIATNGTVVTISGLEFTNASAVNFGGKPAKSFAVISSTKITAVVGDGASGAIMVATPSGSGSKEGFNYHYSLPLNNFKLQTTSESCRSSNNGSVMIKAEMELNYRATIIGSNLNREFQFNKELTIGDLQAGSYRVCITVVGWDSYQQCYNIVITEPQDLSAFLTVKNDQRIMSVNLTGSDRYILEINGMTLTTTNDYLELPLVEGDNKIKIRTEKECQGIIERTIRIERAVPFPNPFERNISIMLGHNLVNTLRISLRDQKGQVVFRQEYANQSGTLQINLPELASGVYLLIVSKDGHEVIYKVMRK